MSGHLVTLDCPPALIPALETLFDAAFSIAADQPVIASREIVEDRLWRLELLFRDPPDREHIMALVAEASAILGQALPEPGQERLPDRDWVAESQRLLAPVVAGRFLVHGSHDRARRRPFGINLEIEAGQAFGTGQHATTRGCLLMIDHLARSCRPRRLLDLGCGSGVLGMAMARVFHRPVTIADIDPIAVRVATENARINRFPLRRGGSHFGIRPVHAAGLRHPALTEAAPYDLLVANILAAPLARMAGDIAGAVGNGGHVILAGLLAHQEARLVAVYRDHGFRRAARLRIGDWPTLMLVRG